MNKSVVIYTRVSTLKQANKGLSLEAQEEICKQYAVKNGYEVLKVFTDRGKSAKTWKNREELVKCLEELNSNVYLLVYSLTRFTRKAEDFADLNRIITSKGSKILSFNENFDGKNDDQFLKWLHVILGQKENDVNAERVKTTMNVRKNTLGSGSNSIQYGWCYKSDRLDKNGKLLPLKIRKEQEVIKKIMELRNRPPLPDENGILRSMSFSKIAEQLNNEGIPSRIRARKGNICKWHKQSVGTIINWFEANKESSLHTCPYDDDDEENTNLFTEVLYFYKVYGNLYKLDACLNIESVDIRKGNPKIYLFICNKFDKAYKDANVLLKENKFLIEDEETAEEGIFTIDNEHSLNFIIVNFETITKTNVKQFMYKDIKKVIKEFNKE